MYSELADDIVNHSIVDLYLRNDKEAIALVIGGTNYILSVALVTTYGDCCSTSWIEHIGNPEACHMARVESFREKDIEPSYDKLSDFDRSQHSSGELKFYFYEIRTSKGQTLIEMRNSSNGYYGGSLDYKGSVPFLEWEGFDSPDWTKVS